MVPTPTRKEASKQLLLAHAGVAVPAPRGISEVRDSKRPQGPVLVFRASAWFAFVNELKANLPA
ncbi:DUF397 domain-containing protein [Streptomyces halstedii]|uniref:DUF397 domain-containing protein n=1 Tax=Streptomyces halstedii TaxID=1944 RepID=A0A6N9U9W7_STRHA|nr:DUF397 domain-containing protein [Streptomyces halstedii]NEA19442.1 DUF397 domain-containing protein [Streptomyces halstedii]